MARRYSSLILIVAIAGCTKPKVRAPNADTVALLRTVLEYAADSLRIGPRIIVARSTRSTPSIRLSLATQNALVSSDTTRLSAAERYDAVQQACDTVTKVDHFCRFPNADGLVAMTDIQMWRDSAQVEFEFFQTMTMMSLGAGVDSATNAKVKGKKELVYNAGTASVARDSLRHWRVRKFSETEFGDDPRGGGKP